MEKIEEISKQLGEPEWLLAWRTTAYELAQTFPRAEKYGIGIAALETAEDPDHSSQSDYQVTPSKGIELYTWKEALGQEEMAPILERLLQSELLPPAASRDAALARAQFQTGLVVYVQPNLDERGESKTETLTLDTTLTLGSSADLIIVVVKTGALFSMKNILHGGEDTSVFNRTVFVLLEGDAKAEVDSSASGSRGFVSLEQFALVSGHAEVNWTEDPDTLARYRSKTTSLLLGEEAKAETLHTLIGTGNASYDIWAGSIHHASNTHSQVYALGLASDTSKIVYRGVVDMKKGVAKVDGAQEARFLIVSPKAEIDAIPQLDIASKEVASSHKLSISHIRDVDLFYAKTRGIPESEARELAIEGFFGFLLSKIKKEDLMESVRERIAILTQA